MLPQFGRIRRFCVHFGLGLAWLVSVGPAHALIASELSVELIASSFTASDGRNNSAVFLELSVPLDPKRPFPVHGGLLQDESTTPVDDVPLDALERDTVETPDPDEANLADPLMDAATLTEPLLLDRQFLADLTQAALIAQGSDEAFARMEHLGTRNRASALLPDVALRAGRERDTALRLTPTDTDPYRYTMSGSTNLLLEGRLSWRLGRLLFSTEDLGIERLRLARSRERQRVVERTMAVLFRWLRAQSELKSGRKLTVRQLRAAKWERAAASIQLDALTAGWFSAHLPAGAPLPENRRDAPLSKRRGRAPFVVSTQGEGTAPSKHKESQAEAALPEKKAGSERIQKP